MRKYHPDVNGGAYSDARAKRINEAYATLSDPGSRAAYDAQVRAADRSARPERAGPSAPRPEPAPPRPSTTPAPKARAKITGLSWRLTALLTIGLAAAGFATGRLWASTPTHESEAVSDPGSKLSPPSPPPAKARRPVPASRDLATIVSAEIVPRWRPDCAAGAEDLVVDLQVNLARNGALLSTRLAGGSGDPARLAAATEKARRAVERSAPFALPPETYRQWRMFIVRFDAQDVCPQRTEPR
jgi:hypothetical protein